MVNYVPKFRLNHDQLCRSDQPVAFQTPFEFPPRPTPGTQPCKELAGYNAARADFDVESDNLAELDLCAVDYDRISSVLDKSALEAEEEAAQIDLGSGADKTLVRIAELCLTVTDYAQTEKYPGSIRFAILIIW